MVMLLASEQLIVFVSFVFKTSLRLHMSVKSYMYCAFTHYIISDT